MKNNITKFSVYEAAPLTEKKVVFTFGRFNPPTTGHEKLIDKVKSVAGIDDYRIYPSQSQNQKKDPLPYAKKLAYMRKMFPKHKRSIAVDKNPKTANSYQKQIKCVKPTKTIWYPCFVCLICFDQILDL